MQTRSHRVERRWRIAEDAREDGVDALAFERPSPGQHLEQHDAERPDVGGRPDAAEPDLLRRHVRGAPDRLVRPGDPGVLLELGDAEVEDLHQSVGTEHHVRRLDVAMHDALGVRLGEPVGDLGGDRARSRRLDRPRSSAARSVSPSQYASARKRPARASRRRRRARRCSDDRARRRPAPPPRSDGARRRWRRGAAPTP